MGLEFSSKERKTDLDIMEALKNQRWWVMSKKGAKVVGGAKGQSSKKEIDHPDEIRAIDDKELEKMMKKGQDDHLLHDVLVVGYGTSSKGTNYFLIRNSYGKTWGIEGLGKIIRASSRDGGGETGSLFKSYSYPIPLAEHVSN